MSAAGATERLAALQAIVEHLVPGQWTAARRPTARELAATSVLALPLAEASVKVRTGGPVDEPVDMDLDVWAGVLPAETIFGPPEPDPELRSGTAVPSHISAFPGTRPGARKLMKRVRRIPSLADTAQIRA